MSEENVEVARSFFAAFADRDHGAAAAVLHPEVEIRPAIVGGPEASSTEGWMATSSSGLTSMRLGRSFGSKPRSSATSATRSCCLDEPSPVQREAASPSMSQRHGLLSSTRGESFGFGAFSNQLEALEAAGLSE